MARQFEARTTHSTTQVQRARPGWQTVNIQTLGYAADGEMERGRGPEIIRQDLLRRAVMKEEILRNRPVALVKMAGHRFLFRRRRRCAEQLRTSAHAISMDLPLATLPRAIGAGKAQACNARPQPPSGRRDTCALAARRFPASWSAKTKCRRGWHSWHRQICPV